MAIPGIGSYKVDVTYRTLPDACFSCKKRGHIARYCSSKSTKEQSEKGGKKGATIHRGRGKQHQTEDPEGFQLVKNQRVAKSLKGEKRAVEMLQPASVNQFEALADLDAVGDKEVQASTDQQGRDTGEQDTLKAREGPDTQGGRQNYDTAADRFR